MNPHAPAIRHLVVLIMLATALNAPIGAHAQVQEAQPGVAPGDRIRVFTGTRSQALSPYVGELMTMTDDSLTFLYQTRALTVPRDWVRRLDVSRGQKRNTLLGAGIGTLTGGVLLGFIAAAGWDCDRKSFSECELPVFGMGAMVGGLPGLLVGTIVGSLVRTDRWERVPVDLDLSLHPGAGGPAGAGLTLRVRW